MEFELRRKQEKLRKEQEERAKLQRQRREKERREKDLAQRTREEHERAARARRQQAASKLEEEAEIKAETERRTAGITFSVDLRCVPGGSGDKLSLPPSSLEKLSGEGALDQGGPMLFEVRVCGKGGGVTHAGVLEFSAEEGCCGVPPKVARCLGLDVTGATTVEVRYVRLPKGQYAVLQPATEELGLAVNHQALLEAALSPFTALTVGDAIPVLYQGVEWQVFVRELRPESAVCVVETDLEVHLVDPPSKGGGVSAESQDDLEVGGEGVPGSVAVGQFRYHRFQLGAAQGAVRALVELEVGEGGDADLYLSPHPELYPTLHDHRWSCHDAGRRKTVCIDDGVESAAAAGKFSVGVYGYSGAPSYTLRVIIVQKQQQQHQAPADQQQQEDFQPCPNCSQLVPTRTAVLHEAYCRRHNAICKHPGCGLVLRVAEMAEHTHCGRCGKGLHRENLAKHEEIEHTPNTCACGCVFLELADLRVHRLKECAHRLINCRFCEGLVASGGEADDVGDRIRGLSRHEAICGSRTRPCETCGRSVKMKDFDLHHAAVHGGPTGMDTATTTGVAEPVSCPLCGESIEGGDAAVTAHVEAHLSTGVADSGAAEAAEEAVPGVACPICGASFPSERHLGTHIDDAH